MTINANTRRARKLPLLAAALALGTAAIAPVAAQAAWNGHDYYARMDREDTMAATPRGVWAARHYLPPHERFARGDTWVQVPSLGGGLKWVPERPDLTY